MTTRHLGLRRALLAMGWLLGATHSAAGQSAAPRSSAPVAWPAMTRDARPWTRWWWMGSAVDSATLTASLQELAAAGFGGVEVTAIYGVRGAEPAYVPYLSPRWVDLIAHTVAQARRLGMAVDMPQGSGWRNGGPFVTPADASASLRVAVDTVRGGDRWQGNLTGRQVNAIVAVSADGQIVDIPHAAPAGVVQWQAPTGTWLVYVADTRFSGDDVKRPAPGGEGLAVDVFSRDATDHYLTVFGQRTATLPRGALRSYFHDSFEYTGNGTPRLFDAFRQRRGYDLAHELPALMGNGDPDRVARVKSDYRQTLDELLLENFVRPLTTWSHAHGSLMREQAHGSPGNILDLYAATDIPETEIFGALGSDSDLLFNKFASSAAHVGGHHLASAESFTWLGEHFTSTLDDVKQAADQLFLSGINHFIYHGTAYSPRDAAWPGWQFYASTEFNPRNAFWHDLPTFNRYVARVQSLLQPARPDHDVLLYWPIWDNWHNAAGMRMDFTVRAPTWLSSKPVGATGLELWKAGYGFDFVSDRLLAEQVSVSGSRLRAAGAGGAEYATLVVPRTDHMPPATFERLVALARSGATVLFVDRLPPDVPGLARLDERRRQLAADERQLALGAPDANGISRAAVGRGRVLVGPRVSALLTAAGVRRESLVDRAGLRFIRQRPDAGGGRQYFISYSGTEPLDDWIPLATAARTAAIMDPMQGRTGLAVIRPAADGGTQVRLHLEPGEAIVLRTFDRLVAGPRWAYHRAAGAPTPLHGSWSVRFVEGGPVLPAAFRSDSLVPWTGRGDDDADRFAGTARYTVRFDAPQTSNNFLLDLGRVAESARVRLNGKELGVLVARPFQLETGPLQPTGNLLEIEVTNLSANRVRDLDRRHVPWKIFRDINYVGLDYKPFDASGWPVRTSGLIGPVTLTPLANDQPTR